MSTKPVPDPRLPDPSAQRRGRHKRRRKPCACGEVDLNGQYVVHGSDRCER